MRRLHIACSLLLLTQPALAQDVSYSGTWNTTFGALKLEQTGDKVSGTYLQGRASLEGTVDGKTLTFRYEEPNVSGEGRFVIAADGASFLGRWREQGVSKWSVWKGTRAKAAPARGAFDGVFEARVGRLRLIQDEPGAPVRGTYEYSGSAGRLKGTVSGRKLSFTWTEGSSNGAGEYTLAADGQSFTGRWRTGEGPWKDWNAKRVPVRPHVVWLVVLEAQWERDLSEREYSFGGMLRSYLQRYPHVQVRQRRFADAPDFAREIRDLAFLPEPVVLVIASHGEQGKLTVEGDTIDPKNLGPALTDAPSVELVHFSSCEMMVGGTPEAIQAGIKGRRVPVSGYAVTVDWSASALLELLYMDLVLGRRLTPARAAELVQKELGFSGNDGTPGSPLGAAQFRFRP